MQQLLITHKITFYSACFVASSLLVVSPAMAEPSGLEGNYWGKSLEQHHPLDLGRQILLDTTQRTDHPIINSILNSDLPQSNSAQSNLHGSFQGRLDLPNTQLSVRGTAAINREAIDLIPTISYDIPVTNNANVYAGAGYSIRRNIGTAPNQGQEAMVLTTGVETAVGQKMIVYGDAKFELDFQDRGDRSPMRLQVGAGYRF